ncbi:hypothetical protein [Saccharothrix deserti]|uniref:hypothetical protein n=1 Tax=Saccharothrix deserti TaxID=2593674 RepID=UPI00131CDE2E|nr:hypothetical protein [Saccharothrix deserti]
MTAHILAIAVDCPSDQVSALEEFWCEALGHRVTRRWKDPKGVEYSAPPCEVASVARDSFPGDHAFRSSGNQARAPDFQATEPAVCGAAAIKHRPVGNEFCVLPPR